MRKTKSLAAALLTTCLGIADTHEAEANTKTKNGVTASTTATSISVSWSDTCGGCAKQLSTRQRGGKWIVQAEVPAGVTSYVLRGLSPRKEYSIEMAEQQAGIWVRRSVIPVATTRAYTVGGRVSGAKGKLTLVNDNGSGGNIDILNVRNRVFKFQYSSHSGNGYDVDDIDGYYSVSMASQPKNQICNIWNGEGEIDHRNVMNIEVTCSASPESVLVNFTGGADGGYPESGVSEGSDGNLYGITANGGTYGLGAFYQYNPGTKKVKVLYSFKGGSTDGESPESGLTQVCGKDFYGVTSEGGANDMGAFYKIDMSGVETLLFSFDGTHGSTPQGLTIDEPDCSRNPNPVFYGTTTLGGAHGQGTIYKITLDGVHSVLYSFGGTSKDGSQPLAGLARSTDGNYYGTTSSGGELDNGTFFQITSSGAYTQWHSFSGGKGDGQFPNTKPLQGNDGNYYGTTPSGGSHGRGTLYKITPQREESLFHSFAGGKTDGHQPASRLHKGLAGDPNLYGVTYFGGNFDLGTVFQITPEGKESLLYSFAGAPYDGRYPNSSLYVNEEGLFGTTTRGGAHDMGTLFKLKY